MGTFEKLGILVIVVIIVMILAVAIYQWGGPGAEAPLMVDGGGGSTVTERGLEDYLDPDEDADRGGADARGGEATDTWDGGIPKTYVVRKRDSVWVLAVRRWRLKDSFVDRIAAANPDRDMKRLRPGDELVIPDPAEYRRGAETTRPRGETGRTYEIQVGDTLESIARTHLGRKSRWREILALNPGLRPERLKTGQVIVLPPIR